MPQSAIKLLLIENNAADVQELGADLAGRDSSWVEIETAASLGAGIRLLLEKDFDLILMNILLPDSHNFEGLKKIHEAAPKTPLVIMTDVHSTLLSIKAVQRGAQDYLVKGQVKGDALKRLILNAIERHRGMTHWEEEQKKRQLELERRATQDELTGLLNRRAIRERLVQEMFRSSRTSDPLSVMLISVDNYPAHLADHGLENMQAMIAGVAGILKHKLRTSDLAGYYAENEFCILAPDTPIEGADILARRICARLAQQPFSTYSGAEFAITCSIGITLCTDIVSDSVVLLARARKACLEAQAQGGDRVIARSES